MSKYSKRNQKYHREHRVEILERKHKNYKDSREKILLQKQKIYLDLKEKQPWIISFKTSMSRCLNPNNKFYKNYGGRGIRFLMTKEDFEILWFRDKAYLMKKPTIDRKDNDGNYVFENCRFMELRDNIIKSLNPRDKRGAFKSKERGGNVYKRILIMILILISLTGTANAMNLKLSEHFYQKEFTCHCGCGETKIDMMLIIKLEELRTALGNKSIIITSGYRCPIHNQRCGGVKNSQHQYGKAADIKVKGLSPSYIGKKAREVGFSFVKVYSGWVHIDVR